jgi:hypothetical protein
MAVKRRKNKRRDGLTENARAWLEGRPCGFFKFKSKDELAVMGAVRRQENFGSRLCVVPKPSQNANYTLQKTYGAPLHEGQRLIQVFSGVARSRW